MCCRSFGTTSLNGITEQLNARKVATAKGGRWRRVQVRQILDQMVGIELAREKDPRCASD